MVGIDGTAGSLTGTTHRAGVTEQNQLVVLNNFRDTAIDAFGRLKVSNPFSLSDNIFKYDKDPLNWDEIIAGSAAAVHLPNESAVNLTCGSKLGDKITFSQRKYNRYQAGRGFSLNMTCAIGSPMNGVVRRWGYCDVDDGLFFELSGTSLGIVRRTSTTGTPVNNRVEQVDWNIDPVNGSGLSGFNLDVMKNNIYGIDFQWLSAGRIEYFIDSDNRNVGKIKVHEEENANKLDGPYMKTATLPLQYQQEVIEDIPEGEIQAQFKAICSTTIVEGGEDPPEKVFGASQTTEQAVGTTETPVIAIQVGSSFQGVENRSVVIPRVFTASSETKQCTFRMLLNPTTFGGTFGSVDPNSSVNFSTGSASFTGGTSISVVTVGKDNSKEFDLTPIVNGTKRLSLTTNASGNIGDILLMTGQSSTATANVIAGLTWGEIR